MKENESKISHHGKHVKWMFLHSPGNSGHKEPGINALAEEYLRLSYHELCAKNKSLSAGQAGVNADYKTDFDPILPKINVVPQDMGRVLPNLINNALYAVLETQHAASLKQTPQKQPDYKPMVMVTTKNKGNHVEIRVKDNGPGIQNDIKDKIFQPFFTTKPTGKGTGLGLSIAYDIMKAHGGEIKFETKEIIGTTFIIELPIN